MTRFARYSTRGIQKPPCEATPWSELAPPSVFKSVDSAATVTLSEDKQSEDAESFVLADKAAKSGSVKKKKKNPKSAKHISNDEENGLKNVPLSTLPQANKKKCKQSPKSLDGKETEFRKRLLKNKDVSSAKVSKGMKSVPTKDVTKGNHIAKKAKKRLKKNGTGNESVSETYVKQDAVQEVQRNGMKRKNKHISHPQEPKKRKIMDEGEVASDASDTNIPSTPVTEVTKAVSGKQNGASAAPLKKKKKCKKPKPPMTAGRPVSSEPPLLAESPLMTQFEGYWVRRRAVPRLERIRAELAAAIFDPQTLKREMKKRKRAEHRQLLSLLALRSGRRPQPAGRGPGRLPADESADAGEESAGAVEQSADAVEESADAAEGSAEAGESADAGESGGGRKPRAGRPGAEERMVKFDGVWMTADAVGRLKELRRKLKLQRVSELVMKQTMKTARRREEMKRKRDMKRVCLGCRQHGHLVGECPQGAGGADGGQAPATGLCFRCGSTEHRLSGCRAKAGDGRLPFAVCFVCGETGHLSRECALNPNGVYPRGGACRVCRQRTHLADECPERREQEAAAGAPRLATLADGGAVEDDYTHDFRAAPAAAAGDAPPAARQPRLVKF